jgi:hypothetical protein
MRRLSVQATQLGLEGIVDDAIVLRGGQLRAVLEVGGLNFALQGEREREATIASFRSFLNSLSYPVQVLVRVLPVDVDGYLAALDRRARQLSGPLADLAYDHVAFVRRLARSRTLLERRFYLVVSVQSETVVQGRLPWTRRSAPGPDPAALRRRLGHRCAEVERQLQRCSLASRRLTGPEIASLLYSTWCSDLARLQRLPRDAGEPPLVVTAAPSPKRHMNGRSS